MVRKIIFAHNVPLIKKGLTSAIKEMSQGTEFEIEDYVDFSQASDAIANATNGDMVFFDVLSWLTLTNPANYETYERARNEGLLFCVIAFQVQSRISRLRMQGICTIIELEGEIRDIQLKLQKLLLSGNNRLREASLSPAKEGILTDRQVEILELMTDGLTNKQIASRLHIDVTTTKAHVSEVLKRLHCSKRSQAVAVYTSNGGLG